MSVRGAGTGPADRPGKSQGSDQKGLGPSGSSTVIGPVPVGEIGIWTVFSRVQSENIADIVTAFAFGFAAAGSPRRNAILSVPPPNNGAAGFALPISVVVEELLLPGNLSLKRQMNPPLMTTFMELI